MLVPAAFRRLQRKHMTNMEIESTEVRPARDEAAKGFHLSLGYEVEDVTFTSKRLRPMPHAIV